MKKIIKLTENDLEVLVRTILKEQQEEECLKPEMEELDILYPGLSELYGAEYEDQEILDMVENPEQKKYILSILKSLGNLSPEQLKDELSKVVSLKNLKEQSGSESVNIAGVDVPKDIVHLGLGIIAISILSSLLKKIGSSDGRRRRDWKLSSRAQGCQGASARAKLVRRRRRRESWRSFLKKIGLR